MDFQRIYREVRNKGFAEINSKFIPTEKFHFAHASDITGNIHYNPKNIIAMNFSEKAIKGVIAHELAHQVDFKRRRRGFFKTVLDNYKCSRDEIFRRGFERAADTITIERGYGKELLEAIKLTKEQFPKDRWKRYEAAHLSIQEVKTLLAKQAHVRHTPLSFRKL